MRIVPPKKRNPNDSTFRNINALKKRVNVLEQEMAVVMAAMVVHGRHIRAQERKATGRGVKVSRVPVGRL